MHKLNILITGISGFIGRSLVEKIVNENLPWKIYGIDIKEPVFNDIKYREQIDFDFLDIRNEKAVKTYFSNKQFDIVLHLAAVSRVIDAEKDKENCIAVNYYGTKYIIENVAKNPETSLIFGSSREVYGEQSSFPVKETAEKNPINIYGRCKLDGEYLVESLISKYAILRFSNVYGNNYDIDGRVIPSFIKSAINGKPLFLEGGDQIIDFTHIDDTIECIIKTVILLKTDKIKSEVIHISPGVENKITDIIQYLKKILGKDLRVITTEKRSYDVVRFIGDPTHRKNILGNLEFKTLYKGIELLIDTLQQNINK